MAASFHSRLTTGIAIVLISVLVNSVSASLTVTTANQQGSLPLTPTWLPAPNSLIAELAPSAASGNFSEETSGRNVNSLTAGGSLVIGQIPGNTTTTNYVTCGNGAGAGASIIYTLPPSSNGYDVTNITIYGGWKDNGRDQQAYSTIYNPASFSVLSPVNYNPSAPSGTASATRVIVSGSLGEVIASNVAAIKFDFTTPSSENGYCGYGAITAQGTPSSPPTGPPVVSAPSMSPGNAGNGITAGTVVSLSASATGTMPIGYQWRTDGGSGGALTNIPGATSTNLTVNTLGYALGTYRCDYVATNSVGTNSSPAAAIAIVAMTDIGASAPTPGPLDIFQLLNGSQNDDGINYYTDDGPSYGKWCGQTFTTGGNPDGYLLRSFAWKSAGNGNNFGNSQLYDLYFYSVSADGSRATLIASYQTSGAGTENDWLQWQGFNLPLAPNETYAYAFGHDASSGGWEHIGNQGGNPYAQGQIMTVSHTAGTGPVTYGNTGNSDAAFDLGLMSYQQPAPRALPPTMTAGVWPIYAGESGTFTLNETALGSGPFIYQWLRDGGAGGALSPINGATSSNLIVDGSGLATGNYNYAVVVSSASGSSLSPNFTVTVLGATAPSVVADITPAPVNVGNVGETVSFSAAFTGTPPLSYQWYFNNGFGPMPISSLGNPSVGSNTLMLSNLQLTNDGIYSVVAQNGAGSVTSSVATLVVNPPANSPPPAANLPPVSLQISNSVGVAHLQWAQGVLQQSLNPAGPWTPIATNLEGGSYTVPVTNAAAFFRSAVASQPRIVNLFCFCRDQDFRLANSQQVLFNATTQEVQLFKHANLPATFALQHDALIDTNYQNYFKAQLGTNDEIGAWWEITQSLAQRAGLTWRGAHEWDPTANVDFSCGYTPAERIQLVDAYMADFQAVFGYYPKTVASWYIDEVTLQYMQQQYGVVASGNCKDQIGTDTYTLWGAYWNQAYYPSKVNSYMPAQTPAGQINMPVFRLLGSDPIYQYGNFTPGIYTLEPVYPYSGGSQNWVAWYFDALINQPSLAFGYAQAGQENGIGNGWDSIGAALTSQVALIAAEAHAGKIQVMTLAQAGEWFQKNYTVTPPTAVVALDDSKQQGRKSVWYDSRFYRFNILWDSDTFYVRDLHYFDENIAASTHNNALTTPYFDYETLPVMDGGQWSGDGTKPVGMWPVLLPGGILMTAQALPSVTQLSPTDLRIVQPLTNGSVLAIVCTETNITCVGTNGLGAPLNWAWDLVGGAQQSSAVQTINSNSISYNYIGASYQMSLQSGSCQQLGNGDIRLTPGANGRMILNFH
jgi:Immunoglobulin I-set domain